MYRWIEWTGAESLVVGLFQKSFLFYGKYPTMRPKCSSRKQNSTPIFYDPLSDRQTSPKTRELPKVTKDSQLTKNK